MSDRTQLEGFLVQARKDVVTVSAELTRFLAKVADNDAKGRALIDGSAGLDLADKLTLFGFVGILLIIKQPALVSAPTSGGGGGPGSVLFSDFNGSSGAEGSNINYQAVAKASNEYFVNGWGPSYSAPFFNVINTAQRAGLPFTLERREDESTVSDTWDFRGLAEPLLEFAHIQNQRLAGIEQRLTEAHSQVTALTDALARIP